MECYLDTWNSRKVKIFMWRAVKNLLPTADSLWMRKIVHDPLCKRCGRTSETTYHVLFECRASQKTWKLTPVRETIRGLIHQNMMDILYELKRSNSTNELEMIVTACWAIWHSRNLFVFERKEKTFGYQWLDQKQFLTLIKESKQRRRSGD